ncbi:MAG: Gfo/Idh/MocA family oxidoreductase [Caldilineaceae bacterium]|nr:Gfo/Idh/MocA family oxidoreductase [Caldilineaceae bacterium]
MDVVRWGIIGCGDVTEVKSGPGLQKAQGSSLVAVMRRNGEKAKDYAARHGVAKWSDDADAIIHDPEVNAVYIATLPNTHAEYTKRVAAAGKPVYVEKPMARTYAECSEMLDACNQAGVPLFVAYYRRRLPQFVYVKELLDAGAIGAVRAVTVNLLQAAKPVVYDAQNLPWRITPELSGGGFFFDLASHELDILDYLLGPITEAEGMTGNQAGLYAAEDIVTGTFRFASGVQGTGVWSFTVDAHEQRDQIELIGDKGRIQFACFDLDRPVVVVRQGQTEEKQFTMPAHVQQPLIQTVVDQLLGRGQCPSTGESGARASWVMEQLTR